MINKYNIHFFNNAEKQDFHETQNMPNYTFIWRNWNWFYINYV